MIRLSSFIGFEIKWRRIERKQRCLVGLLQTSSTARLYYRNRIYRIYSEYLHITFTEEIRVSRVLLLLLFMTRRGQTCCCFSCSCFNLPVLTVSHTNCCDSSPPLPSPSPSLHLPTHQPPDLVWGTMGRALWGEGGQGDSCLLKGGVTDHKHLYITQFGPWE